MCIPNKLQVFWASVLCCFYCATANSQTWNGITEQSSIDGRINKYGQLTGLPTILPHTKTITRITVAKNESNQVELVYYEKWIFDKSGKAVKLIEYQVFPKHPEEYDTVTTFTYDGNKVTEYHYCNDEFSSYYTYDKNGILAKSWCDGYPCKYHFTNQGYIRYGYFEDGKTLWTKKEVIRKGKTDIIRNTDYLGSTQTGTTTKTTYNNQGDAIQITDKEGNAFYYNYKYDENGNKICEYMYDSKNNSKLYYEYKYNYQFHNTK